MLGNLFTRKKCSDELQLNALKENGTNLNELHVLTFCFKTDNVLSARAIAEELTGKGFNATILLPDDESFSCQAKKELIPELQLMRSLTKELKSLAQQHDSAFNGWEVDNAE
jgi:hypothetical protein